ncbi:hypothetical protein [Cellulosimicrobium arenosum]|uniref:Proteins of 100 residues with WXG n=1 Tax=Cellulosimicrobium arenosum TaxID=2708133 RepID=A0A927J296_9MICO|nr:hypothetical protein [Cellulosimicrobium arenosum]MBD8080573.1 hypothetical protein [Cellulosimicrobium arenosum]
MAGLWGANVEELRGLGTTLQQKAEEIKTTMQTLNQQIQSVQWQGPDADQFKGNDWPAAQTQLNQVSQTLTDAGNKATQNAQAQEQTSNS